MNKIVLLLPLLAACATSLSVDFDAAVFEFCCADDACSSNFQLAGCSDSGYARKRFSYMLNDMMQSLQIGETAALAGEDLLHAVLRSYQFCGVNQEVDPSGVCQCQHGKLCEYKPASDFKLSPTLQIALAVLTMLFVFFFSSKILHRLQKLEGQTSSIAALSDFIDPARTKWT